MSLVVLILNPGKIKKCNVPDGSSDFLGYIPGEDSRIQNPWHPGDAALPLGR